MTRLTEEMVIARSKQSDLSSIKKLNCWGSDLTDVTIIRKMRGVEVLALSVNKIKGLSDFENCHKLQELYLRKNNINDINDLVYLQGLKHLQFLWLEENPCVENAGPNYRQIVLRALPNLKKLDNIEVTADEVADAISGASMQQPLREEEVYDDAYNNQQQQQQQPPPQSQSQQQQQQWRSQSPIREKTRNSPEYNEDYCINNDTTIDRNSIPSSPLQRSSPNQDYSPAEPNHPPPSSPKFNRDHRGSYHQSYDRSPGSDQDSPVAAGYRERAPIVPSMSTHSMKEYYQSDRPTPTHYRHSQTDLTEWDEHNNNNNNNSTTNNSHNNHNNSINNKEHHPNHNHGPHHQYHSTPTARRNGPERETNSANYQYRNGGGSGGGGGGSGGGGGGVSGPKEEWEDADRPRPRDTRRSEGRYSDTASVVSSAVLNHYAGYHRRPVNRSSNLLSAALCLVKELDYPSLEVVEHAIRCRIDELSAD